MTATERVNCPVCDSVNATQVRYAADIVTCNSCGLTYLRTRPSVKELEQFYQTYASAPGSHMKLPQTKEQVKSSGLRRDYFLKEVMEHTGDRKGLLIDIGAGWGAFLDNARDHGFQVAGNEICRQMARFAWDTLNIHTHSLQIEDCPFKPQSASVVTALHTLEHLPNQRIALGYIHSLLEDGGWFCGIVPNFGSFLSQTMGDSWYWLDPNFHYSHWDPDTLTKTLYSFGFMVHRIYTATDDFDCAIINQQLVRTGTRRTVKELEEEGRGEAIRFYAQRV